MDMITEKTLVPISLLAVLAGGVFWLSSMYAQTTANAQAIVEIKEAQKDDRREIIERLNHIDNKIDRLLRQTK